ncbi:MAG: hypothetical protein JWR08_2526 [Enterovirga sp.]|jgi:uncharacterized membrane protein|nr:hypothetical protein [Enterovirga sp.]
MTTAIDPGAVPPRLAGMAGPAFPASPGEFITVLAHYHRAEIARMAGWRDRIDRTTNWAITVVAGMLSVSLSTPTAHQGVLLFAMVLVLLLLRIEARRYRFFDVYRARVRRLERNYYAQIFAPTDQQEEGWTRALGEDLRRPIFLITVQDAMARRLRRNYGWMFLILLLAWVIKITSAKLQPGAGMAEFAFSVPDTIENAALGPLPGWSVLAAVLAFYLWLLYATLRPYARSGELAHGNVHV